MENGGEDFVSSIVPLDERKSWVQVIFIWMGFILVVGIMAVGGGLASQMPVEEFFISVLVGNLVLGAFALVSGYIGAESGKTFNQLMSDAFPGWSWKIVSLYAPVVLIGWFGVEAAIFGNFLGEVFGWTDFGRRVAMVLSTLGFAASSYIGFRAIQYVSIVAVPIILLLGWYAIYYAYDQSSLEFGFGGTQLSLGEGISIVMGSWIMGVLICLPDLTRYSRSPISGALTGFSGIFVANIFTFFVGGLAAALAGESDPAKVLVSFGFLPLAFILSLANIWTTNDNNMYSAALNIARAAGITRHKAVIACTLFAAVYAAFDPTSINALFTFLGFMGNTAPALGGVVLGAYLWNRNRIEKLSSPIASWGGWIMGSGAGWFAGGAWAVFVGVFSGFLVWLAISATVKKQGAVLQNISGE